MPLRMPKVDYDVVMLAGGVDQVTPSLVLKPGVLRDALNFECSPTGGYSRIGGYERYDGHASPSAASYSIVQVVSFTNTPTVGQTLTGQTSSATGQIIAVGANYVALTNVSGTFTTSEVVKVSSTTIGTATMQTVSISPKVGAQYQAAAADAYRSSISAVPGSGPVRGVFGMTINGVDTVYAFRDNVGATATNMYVASVSGWTQVAYKQEISFTAGGTTAPADGATLTKGGVTAVVRRVMDSSGSWAGSTAAGRFVIDTPVGGAFTAGAATLTGGASVTLAGASTAITMSPGGKFEFFLGNFTGSKSTLRMFGCDGVNRGFEFDGTTLAPIPTGASTDAPKHVVVHKNQLFFGMSTSAMQSGPGTPYRFGASDSGSEIAIGDTLTGFLVQPGAQTTAALAIFGRSSTFMLYGTGLTTWNLVPFNTGVGALDYTTQNMAQSYLFDDQFGVVALSTTLAYGNFEQASLTNNIKALIAAGRTKIAYSALNRGKNQYRVFFNDGTGLYLTIVNGKMMGSMPVLFPNPVYCAWEGAVASGAEVSFIGATNGFVYQNDVGSSFDGANIDAYIVLNWDNMRSPRVKKRMRHSSIEMQGNFYAEVYFGYQLGYGTTEIPQSTPTLYTSSFSAAPAWDAFTWDAFTWDGRTLAPTEVGLNGTAENIQITISSTGNYIYPYTLNSIINHFTPRRGLR